ncbi:MAG: four-carbon acid sugar kinase family protein [Bryobacteraceae bacterium]
MKLLALADDLTGAVETGAKFAAEGVAALVAAEFSPPRRRGAEKVLVLNCESRHLTPVEAASRVRNCVAANQFDWLYKKTDSTLRGNIGSELNALLDVCPNRSLIYAPAYPRLGRTVRNGCLYVDGRPLHETSFAWDRLNPVRESSVPALLAPHTSHRIFTIGGRRQLRAALESGAAAIFVCDAESDEEIMGIAEEAAASPLAPLAAGPAAFAECLARLLPFDRTYPDYSPCVCRCLVVNGSLHEVSKRQVENARAPVFALGDEKAAIEVLKSGWAVLATRPELGDAAAIGDRIGRSVRSMVEQAQPDALVVFGGDTASAVLRALSVHSVQPFRELLPGVPLSRLERPNLALVTKAGGFGPADLIPCLRDLASRGW